MEPHIIISILVASFLLTFAIQFFTSNELQANRQMKRAVKAFERFDWNAASQLYRQLLDDYVPRLKNKTLRRNIEFVAEQGLGNCAMQLNDYVSAREHFTRALELSDEGVKQQKFVIVHTMAELAIAQNGSGYEEECHDTLNRIEDFYADSKTRDAQQIAEFVTGAANGAASVGFNDLAHQIAQLCERMLRSTDAWKDGSLAHTQIAMASYHMMHCEHASARELIENALALAGDKMSRKDQADACFNLGYIHLLSGNLSAAIESMTRSYELRTNEFGETHIMTSICLVGLADIAKANGLYADANERYREAFEIQSGEVAESSSIKIGTAMNWAHCLMVLGDFAHADRLLKDASEYAEENREQLRLTGIRLFQGFSEHLQLRHHDAEITLEMAVEMAKEIYGPGHRMTFDYLLIQSANLFRLGRYEESTAIVEEIVKRRTALVDGSVIDLADTLQHQAEVYAMTNRINEAERALQRASSLISNDVISETHMLHATIAETHGTIAHERRQFDRAILHYEEAMQIRDSVQAPDHPSYMKLLEHLADSLEQMSDSDRAQEYRNRAEQIRTIYL